MEIVLNTCYGGFGLSKRAIKRYFELIEKECYFYITDYTINSYRIDTDMDVECGLCTHIATKYLGKVLNMDDGRRELNNNYFSEYSIIRTDPLLIKVIKELGEASNGRNAKLKIIEIPDDVEWEIEEYDGIEHIAEYHRTWN